MKNNLVNFDIDELLWQIYTPLQAHKTMPRICILHMVIANRFVLDGPVIDVVEVSQVAFEVDPTKHHDLFQFIGNSNLALR